MSAVANLAEQTRIRRRLRGRVCAILALPEDAAVSVNRIDCPDATCLEGATVVLVMRPGRKSQARTITKPPEAVTDDDLRAALAGLV
ncbi:hypothetical protein PY365_23565 [Roseiarcaceae bacterium H3SJ34-1]|uniref:hypothetical protein n=1 Tax=Terripilifer ovatus TaxID=3032367 RepID=UPI003AB9B834|nr:hypothetical protein [Roseiarcaceae bacterium H3SJ34-1]